jgi:hypothetical protein
LPPAAAAPPHVSKLFFQSHCKVVAIHVRTGNLPHRPFGVQAAHLLLAPGLSPSLFHSLLPPPLLLSFLLSPSLNACSPELSGRIGPPRSTKLDFSQISPCNFISSIILPTAPSPRLHTYIQSFPVSSLRSCRRWTPLPTYINCFPSMKHSLLTSPPSMLPAAAGGPIRGLLRRPHQLLRPGLATGPVAGSAASVGIMII